VLSVESTLTADLLAPPLWAKEATGANPRRLSVMPPATTAAHTADLTVTLTDGQGTARGELSVRVPVK